MKPTQKPVRAEIGAVVFGAVCIVCAIPFIVVACGIAVMSWVFEEEARRAEKDKFNS